MSQDGEKAPEVAADAAPVEEAPPKDDAAKSDGTKKTDKKALALPMKNPMDSEPYVSSAHSEDDIYNLSPCCCCLCACSHDRVGDATCFGCLPIRCGIMFIAIQIFVLAITLITVTFFQLLNEYLPWWYVFITLLLLIPIAIAASQMVYFFARDNRSTRGTLFGAVILTIIATSLWCTWQLIFFLAIYKKDTVYTGMGNANDESNYHPTPKRTYLFTVLAETAFILGWLAYYTCVANQYWNLMNDSYDREDKEAKIAKEKREKAEKQAAKEKKEADKAAEKAKKEAAKNN